MKDILDSFREYLLEMQGARIQARPTLRLDKAAGESDEQILALADSTFIRMLQSDNPESPLSKLPDLKPKQMGLFTKRLDQQVKSLPSTKRSEKIKAGLLAFKDALGKADTLYQDPPKNTVRDFSPAEKGRMTQKQGSKTVNRAPVYEPTLDMKGVIKEAKILIDSLIKE